MSQYFDENPTSPSAPRDVVWALPDLNLTLSTDSGVFGYGHVDAGTRLLLLNAPTPPIGHLLDLGCGTGAIALTMGRRSPASTVWAIDVNGRARDLCFANAARNSISNVVVAHPDEIPDDVRFEAIWSNPPIRIGKPALHSVLIRWLGRLTPTGQAYMVVHKHLGSDSLRKWLVGQGFAAERVAVGAGFRVLCVRSCSVSAASRVDFDPKA